MVPSSSAVRTSYGNASPSSSGGQLSLWSTESMPSVAGSVRVARTSAVSRRSMASSRNSRSFVDTVPSNSCRSSPVSHATVATVQDSA